jgi:hypothetical protein
MPYLSTRALKLDLSNLNYTPACWNDGRVPSHGSVPSIPKHSETLRAICETLRSKKLVGVNPYQGASHRPSTSKHHYNAAGEMSRHYSSASNIMSCPWEALKDSQAPIPSHTRVMFP